MGTNKQALKALINKLQFNPISLGGNSKYTTKIGILIGAIIMIIVTIYAIGLFSVIQDKPNVVTNTFSYKNDPYQINLKQWNLRLNIYQNITQKYVNPQNMYQLGLNITAWNLQGQQLNKKNPSSLISSNQSNIMIPNNQKTPFIVSGSHYVHGSPPIKQYLVQLQFCTQNINPKCNEDKNRVYLITLLLNPKWAYLQNPKQSAIRQMGFNQKIKINRKQTFSKFQYTYDIAGFNVTSDTSLLPTFFPRSLKQQNGSSMAGPATKIYLPQQSNNIIQFYFRRSQNSQSHTIKFNSIDVIFAQILGVVALFGLILWVLFAHYNQWGSQQYILNSIDGLKRKINLFQYIKFYLTCHKLTKKQQKILQQVHQNIIQSYKQRKRRKIQIEILKLRINKIEDCLNLKDNQNLCKQIIRQKLQEEEKQELFSSSILTEEIKTSLLNH